MDKPAANPAASPLAGAERWIKRLAQAQADRDELVRLLGLLRILGGIATHCDSLEEGARAMAQHLVNYLGLTYCGFYVRREGQEVLKASHGQDPPPAISDLLREKVAAGTTFAGQMEQDGNLSQLACLPLLGNSDRLGGLAMVLGNALDARQRRHLGMVAEAVAPVLENLIMRGRLQEFNHNLRQESRRAARSLAELDQAHQETEACLSGLMHHDPEPLFVLDGQGRLLRLNPALEELLGWSGEHLQGRRLAEFLAQPEDWRQISRWLELGLPGVECEVPLLVQCGVRTSARLQLHAILRDGQVAGTLGRLSPARPASLPQGGLMSAQEVEDLAERCGDVGYYVNNLLTALRANLQLAMLQDLEPHLRRRLEVMEFLTEESKGVTRQVSELVDQLRQRCQKASVQARLWPVGQLAMGPQAKPQPQR